MRFLTKLTLFGGLGIIGLVVLGAMPFLTGSEVTAQPFPNLDHFKCYQTQRPPINIPVRLQDQFDVPNFENVVVGRPLRFCNPVQKTRGSIVTEIRDPDAHLKLYRIMDSAPTRQVTVRNQFGINQKLQVFEPRFLAVPTRKLPHPPPNRLDHFKCYRANGLPINATVDLKDQFHTETGVRVLQPYLFCNPVRKIHANVVTPIQNPSAHLVCYAISKKPLTKTVRVRNQFGDETLVVKDADTLCVPSQKLAFSQISGS